MNRRYPALLSAMLVAGCAAPPFRPAPPAAGPRVVLTDVAVRGEIADEAWKSLVDVAADAAGNAAVLDASTHRVFVCDPRGARTLAIGETGFFSKTFPHPTGVAAGPDGRIFVADAKEDCVQVYDPRGAFLARIGGRGAGPGRFRRPGGIDVDGEGNLYVVDRGNARVQRFDPRGALMTQIVSGPRNVEKINISRAQGPVVFDSWPAFKAPRDVAVGPGGTVYLLDAGTCLVHAYTPEGGYLFSFGGRGRRAGSFERPAGIAAGAMGVVCVSDERRHGVQFFSPDGRYLLSVGRRGRGRGEFLQPQGVGAGPDGLVFVADRGNRRVQVFSYAVPRPVAVRLEKPVRIAVFDFRNNNPAAQARGYGESISEMFVTAFAGRQNFEVIERKQIREVVDEIFFDQSGVVDAETTKRIGRVLGVDVALAGGVSLVGNRIEIDLRLLDVETGKVIIAESFRADYEGQLRDLVNREVGRLEQGYIIRALPPAPPAGLVVTGDVRKCLLSWRPNDEPDLREYRVWRAPSPDGPFALIGRTTKTVWTDEGLGDGEAFVYRVTAVDADGMESAPLPGTAGSAAARPAIGAIAARTGVEVRRNAFSWTEDEKDVAGYAVYRAASPGGPFEKVGETRAPRFSERGFGDGETSWYRVVKRYRSGLESEPSDPIRVATKPVPATPAAVAARSGLARRVELEWAAAPERDIREYRVYRSRAEDGDWRRIAAVKPGWFSGPSFTDRGLEDDAEYFYSVQSVDRDNLASPRSAPVRARTKPRPAAPRDVTAEGGRARRVPLSWRPNEEGDIASYRVFAAREPGGTFRPVGETASTTFTHTGIADATGACYKIRAVDRDGLVSDFSETVSAATRPRPARPSGLEAVSGLPRSVRLSWSPGPERDISRYIVSRRRGRRGAFREVGTASSAAHMDGGLEDGVAYEYVVRAVDAEGLVSDPSEPAAAVTREAPPRPVGLRAEAGASGVLLTWEPGGETVAHYEVFRRSSGLLPGGETKVGRSAESRFEDRTAAPGRGYAYRVRAVDADGLRSPPSEAAAARSLAR
ncbi:MAG: CsgG/HfaB family protein [bacterium]|nr:CsgG/HfaB family protein [bacterium]